MVGLNFIDKYLKEHLSKKRYIHSLNVADIAASIAEHYDVDESKARLAGLIHDCSKEESYEDLVNYAQNCGFPVDEESYNIPEILHGPGSVYIARSIFGIDDVEVLSSVRYHVTGKENMTLMEKIVFIADYIEPSRKFDGIDNIRDLVYQDIDKALLFAFDLTIKYIIDRKGLLHHDTVDARNFLIKNTTL
ncbi:bis(5'-nucleosyl)-tetraphosphatase (symmetrical) YqeK [Lutispora thermophila]|uniref:bis(5'-nucleosyl)-tetraphosphatase (symmetrical) n=1 Tax=Lutispora thermophila DSM 19022 TaxID=1122184 RepID=A0A1M6DAG1_9FIRM|nr:bis(5'-nucleosyl)-tetraphosphatase (symmetrical) YqeK [Lutispora thermophila]SHI70139.1 putative HD superfamily hydrolase of NAD metabolism [Lutispora thermophila DSM 19022]